MTDATVDPARQIVARVRRLHIGIFAGVCLVGVMASALDKTSLLVAGALLIGWSQLVGL